MKVTYIKPDTLNLALFQNNEEVHREFQKALNTCSSKVSMFGFYDGEGLIAMTLMTIREAVELVALYLPHDTPNRLYDVIQYLKMQYVKKDIQTTLNLPMLKDNEFEYDEEANTFLYDRNKHPEDQFKDLNGKLRAYPAKLSDKQTILNYIATHIDSSRQYKESELNTLIQSLINFEDYVTIRRDLYDSHYIDRDPLTSMYWKKLKYSGH